MVVGAGAAVLGRAVDLAETANTDGLAEVDVTSDSGGTDVVPVYMSDGLSLCFMAVTVMAYQSAS